MSSFIPSSSMKMMGWFLNMALCQQSVRAYLLKGAQHFQKISISELHKIRDNPIPVRYGLGHRATLQGGHHFLPGLLLGNQYRQRYKVGMMIYEAKSTITKSPRFLSRTKLIN